MILAKDHEARGGNIPARGAVAAPAKARIFSRVDETFPVSFHELLEVAIILIIAALLGRERGAQRMMEVIIPLGIETKTAEFTSADQAGVIGGAFGKEHQATVEVLGLFSYGITELFKKSEGRMVENRMYSIEA